MLSPACYNQTQNYNDNSRIQHRVNTPKFVFQQRHGKISWRQLHNLDLDRLVREGDTDLIEQHLRNLTFSRFDFDDLQGCSDSQLLKLVQLCQLSCEYLLHMYAHATSLVSALNQRASTLSDQYQEASKQKDELCDQLLLCKKELRQKKKTLCVYELLSKQERTVEGIGEEGVGFPVLCKCHVCGKQFLSSHYLQQHMSRRHPTDTYHTTTCTDTREDTHVGSTVTLPFKHLDYHTVRDAVKTSVASLSDELSFIKTHLLTVANISHNNIEETTFKRSDADSDTVGDGINALAQRIAQLEDRFVSSLDHLAKTQQESLTATDTKLRETVELLRINETREMSQHVTPSHVTPSPVAEKTGVEEGSQDLRVKPHIDTSDSPVEGGEKGAFDSDLQRRRADVLEEQVNDLKRQLYLNTVSVPPPPVVVTPPSPVNVRLEEAKLHQLVRAERDAQAHRADRAETEVIELSRLLLEEQTKNSQQGHTQVNKQEIKDKGGSPIPTTVTLQPPVPLQSHGLPFSAGDRHQIPPEHEQKVSHTPTPQTPPPTHTHPQAHSHAMLPTVEGPQSVSYGYHRHTHTHTHTQTTTKQHEHKD
eukprot:GHVR01074108.1.p1 GENE.GHVR01074108.1~~GHVR01074108.1.p1  ORF type:complete len:590 (+),score=146.01 GHVR01074108.1:75-1844(+)